MKKLLGIIALGALALSACNSDDDTEEVYRQWRKTNMDWITELQQTKNPDGTDFYKVLVPKWDPANYVLIHYFNDRAETEGNLSPLYTSTATFRYELRIYPDSLVDASYKNSDNGLSEFQLNSVVPGWSAACMDMRCGDTCEVVVPYALGYGLTGTGIVPPYTTLRFNIRLVDIDDYEKAPY